MPYQIKKLTIEPYKNKDGRRKFDCQLCYGYYDRKGREHWEDRFSMSVGVKNIQGEKIKELLALFAKDAERKWIQ